MLNKQKNVQSVYVNHLHRLMLMKLQIFLKSNILNLIITINSFRAMTSFKRVVVIFIISNSQLSGGANETNK